MTDEEALALEKILQNERSSFIRYVVESSEPEIRDEFDRRVFAFYEEWDRESSRSQDAISSALEGRAEAAGVASYPLEFSQFNYLSSAYLLKAVISRMSEHVSALEALGRRIVSTRDARELVSAIIERHGVFLKEARKLEGERPARDSRPPRIKGTSASRW